MVKLTVPVTNVTEADLFRTLQLRLLRLKALKQKGYAKDKCYIGYSFPKAFVDTYYDQL